ncbi:MAG: phosphoribosylformylglycinamidine synthase, partial [Xanthomonadales bacterium]|nr:phosphoribosylformylglycinamidine synthase [Xanthomonadales bacterium]
AASSMVAGRSSEALDFASVQRDNPEMERRCQAVINAACAYGDDSPIVSIHDVGAGGLSNAIPELLHDSGMGGRIDLAKLPNDDPGLSPMQLWSNEAQERYVLGVRAQDVARFRDLCERENCPFAVVGAVTAQSHLMVADTRLPLDDPQRKVVDLPMDVLFGKAPRMLRDAVHVKPRVDLVPDLDGISVEEAVKRVLRLPVVGSKSFLITIGDRSVGGLVARDPMVGPWQVPVADCAMHLTDFDGYRGEAMALAERAPLALLDSADAARMTVGEVITNMIAAPLSSLGDIRLSANWMAAVDQPGDDAALFDAVRAIGLELCPSLGISIPVGKDSLSMRTRWHDGASEQTTVSPVSLVVTGFAAVDDVRGGLTPQLQMHESSQLWLLDLGGARDRMGGSALAQVFNRNGGVPPDLDDPAQLQAFFALIKAAREQQLLLAYHDRSDGGVLVTLLEMAFAGHCGLQIHLDGWAEATLRAMFCEELGAVVQVAKDQHDAFAALLDQHGMSGIAKCIGEPRPKLGVKFTLNNEVVHKWRWSELFEAWQETSYTMQRLRDNPACVDAERNWRLDDNDPGISPKLSFDPVVDVAAPYIQRGERPRVA